MKKSMIFKGFKFGSLLQLAVGPICIYIFNTSISKGFINALFGVIGVGIVDGVFIVLSIFGVTTLIKKNEIILRLLGSVVLIFFGCNIIFNVLFINDSNTYLVQQSSSYIDTFFKAIILTGANPLTIIFWSGVFSSKIIEEDFSKNDEFLFGLGAVISTIIWLTVVSMIGQLTSVFLNGNIIRILNAIVGFILIYFGVRLCFKKKLNKN